MAAQPSPTPSVTPENKPRTPQPTPSPKPKKPAKPVATPTPKSTPSATPSEEPTPASNRKHKKSDAMNSQVPFVPAADKTAAPVVETKSPLEVEAEETSHVQAAKAKALQDKHVQELQAAADSATGDQVKTTSRRYYKALFEKMREIDPSVKDRIDRTEAATLRRLEQQNPQ